MDMLQMHDPAHPGELLRSEVLGSLGLSVTAAAEALRIGRQALSAVVNGKSSLTPEMALRLEKAFGISMELLLRMQLNHDIAKARRTGRRLRIPRYKPAA
jgi:addiction module HigA family antidote